MLLVGTPVDLTYPFEHLGTNADVLEEIAAGTHPVCEKIKGAKLPLMIVGRDAISRKDGESILKCTKQIANSQGFINAENNWNGYNILNRSQG